MQTILRPVNRLTLQCVPLMSHIFSQRPPQFDPLYLKVATFNLVNKHVAETDLVGTSATYDSAYPVRNLMCLTDASIHQLINLCNIRDVSTAYVKDEQLDR
jgi:hypothetical protein